VTGWQGDWPLTPDLCLLSAQVAADKAQGGLGQDRRADGQGVLVDVEGRRVQI